MSQDDIAAKVKKAVEEDPSKNYIQSVALFGSSLRGDDNSQSDIDLLYEMKKTMGLFQIAALHHRLEQKLGKRVDFVERSSLLPELQDEIFAQAKIIYE